ncbi:MAG: hypothetical protein DCF25_12240 [Leptolyngbya foveolarum]|uniref:Uncharacterized protein n=1 Tax=Leptolyngbya foveolarum TaxID=47253 RepID=A0A2W4W3K0_9CYAN|nr:MAG: hypothetical protein DCF25_12240 [Leptolyngbya foveolarum]
MPKPCSKPLAQNPYKTYRDPVTGQWKVEYPAQTQPFTQTETACESTDAVELLKHRTKLRQWRKSSQTKVA